jgi:hypothetical protein
MMSEALFMGNRFAPVTSHVGFLRASLRDVCAEMFDWRSRTRGDHIMTPFDGGLVRNVHHLEPLTLGWRPRELIVSTHNPEWVAVFDCGARGGDPVSTIGYLSRELGVRGVYVVSIPPAPPAGRDPHPWGARQLGLLGPEGQPPLKHIRETSVIQDGPKWRFDAVGEVQDFEDTAAYTRRRVTERFTDQMLIDYAKALGLDPFNPDFYPGPSVLVENTEEGPQDLIVGGIQETQRQFGILVDR